MSEQITQRINRTEHWGLRVGLGGLAVSILIGLFAHKAFFFGYLSAFLMWWGIPLGCGGILMMHHLTAGRWGWSFRPALAAGVLSSPLFVVLFLPVLFGMHSLYHWTHEESSWVQGYLNTPFFIVRAVVFFALWGLGGWLLYRRSLPLQERTVDPTKLYPTSLSAVGMILYFLTASFAAIDWIGSLESHWYSSVFGLYIIVGQALTALAMLTFTAAWMSETPSSRWPTSAEIFHDLGKLLLTLVILHAYMGFSQFIVIWNGNLPHEVSWYTPRTKGFWGGVTLFIVLVHFALPFALLLSREVKRSARSLMRITGAILVARVVEAMWMVLPSLKGASQILATIVALIAMAGIGGIWLAVFIRVWRRGPLLIEALPNAEAVKA